MINGVQSTCTLTTMIHGEGKGLSFSQLFAYPVPVQFSKTA